MINFKEFYEENYARQVNTIRRHTTLEAAEDIVQEAYVRALKYVHSYDEERASINVWFNSIMFNVLKETKRKSVVTEEYEEDRSLDMCVLGSDLPRIQSILDEFPIKNKKHAEVIRLYFIIGYDSKEISEIIPDISQTNVMTITARFRRELQKKYGFTI